jgi:hypothetical protein
MFKLVTRLPVLTMAWLLVASAASAQWGPYYGFGGWGGGMGAGSTPMGSYLSGMAQTIRAQGQYNVMSSQAAINLEQAQSMDIDNQLKWTNTYFEMRRVNDAYAKAKQTPRLSSETLAQMARDAAPARLPSNDLDAVTGQIAWPAVLQNTMFDDDRENLERLFTDRAVMHGAIGTETHGLIRNAVDAMLAKLKDHIRDFDTRNYLEARSFLISLGNESNYPTTAS